MAANQAALLNYLTNTLLFPVTLRQAVLDEGVQAIDDFINQTDKDVKNICKNIRSPGGTIANPLAGDPGQPAEIPNRGITVGFVYEKRLRQLRYYRWHLHRIQRPWNAVQASLARLNELWTRFELEESAKDNEPAYPEPFKKIEDVRKVIENIDDWLDRRLGVRGSPLAYVTRPEVLPPGHPDLPDELDPGFGLPTLHAELVRRTRHDDQYYRQDQIEVWNMLRHVAHGGPGWSWISTYARQQDGREAYLSFKRHYLGESFTARTVAAADRTLETIFYDGKARNFTFEQFSEKLTKAFTDLGENEEPYSDAKKVRKLLAAIVDPALNSAKTTVLATPNLRSSYDEALNFLAEVADTQKQMQGRHRNISSVRGSPQGRGGRASSGRSGRSGGGRGRGRGGRSGNQRSAFDRRDPGRTYSPQEWRTLTEDERAQVRTSRENRKRKAAAVGVQQDEPDNNPSAPAEGAQTGQNSDTHSTGIGNTMTRRGGR
jgi:uncharacterized membrane protein YgcG